MDGLARPTVSQLRPPACYRPTVLYCTVHCYSLLYCTEHCNSLLHCTVLYTYTALYCTVLFTVLYTVTAHLARSHESIEGGQLGIGRKGQPTPENGWPASTMRRCRRHPEYIKHESIFTLCEAEFSVMTNTPQNCDLPPVYRKTPFQLKTFFRQTSE